MENTYYEWMENIRIGAFPTDLVGASLPLLRPCNKITVQNCPTSCALRKVNRRKPMSHTWSLGPVVFHMGILSVPRLT
jgi:hypothetical protein